MHASSTSEADLTALCRAGDEAAWEELVERYSRYVFAIAARAYGLSGTDAEDVFQEVFARAYERLDDLRDDSALRPWLAQMTRRLCVDRKRSGSRERPVENLHDEVAVDDELSRLDEALAVRECLERLPENCQEIVDRFFLRDQSYKTIGEALDIPSGTIASRISRCLAKLRAELAD